MGRGHPECPERLDAIEDRMLASQLLDAVDRREAPLASTDILELAHDRMHVAAMRGLAEELREQEDAGGMDHLHIDPDTSIWQRNLHGSDPEALALRPNQRQ